MDGVALLEEARAAGLVVECRADKLVIRGPRNAEPLALLLIEHKSVVLPLVREPLVPWMLQEWRRVSIPDWRRILRESVTKGDKGRADYALWMLTQVLFDPEYEEDQ